MKKLDQNEETFVNALKTALQIPGCSIMGEDFIGYKVVGNEHADFMNQVLCSTCPDYLPVSKEWLAEHGIDTIPYEGNIWKQHN